MIELYDITGAYPEPSYHLLFKIADFMIEDLKAP